MTNSTPENLDALLLYRNLVHAAQGFTEENYNTTDDDSKSQNNTPRQHRQATSSARVTAGSLTQATHGISDQINQLNWLVLCL